MWTRHSAEPYIELTSVENEHIEEMVQQSIQQLESKAASLTQTFNARFDTNEQVIANRLDALRLDGIKSQAVRQHALDAKLENHYQSLTTCQKVHQNSLTAIRRSQASAATSQSRLLQTSTQISKRTVRISRDLNVRSLKSSEQHQRTRDLIVSTFKDVQAVQAHPAPRASSGRQIVYAGEERDLIIPALHPVKRELAAIFDQLFTDHSRDVLPSHIAWLQAGFQNLIASAAQEASTHPMSTATSFDTWIYLGEMQGSSNGPEDQDKERWSIASRSSTNSEGQTGLFL